MFEQLKEPSADKILMLMQLYREDPREQKIDLGVGVYKNPEGVTPIMRAIKAAGSTLDGAGRRCYEMVGALWTELNLCLTGRLQGQTQDLDFAAHDLVIGDMAANAAAQAVLAEALRSRGIEPRLIEPRGAFLLVPHPDAMEMSRRLKDAGVNTDARPCPSGKTAHVRLCPDILNTEAELHRAAEIMAGLLAPR